MPGLSVDQDRRSDGEGGGQRPDRNQRRLKQCAKVKALHQNACKPIKSKVLQNESHLFGQGESREDIRRLARSISRRDQATKKVLLRCDDEVAWRLTWGGEEGRHRG